MDPVTVGDKLKIFGITIRCANYCPYCGMRLQSHLLHVCGQFDISLGETRTNAENIDDSGWLCNNHT